MTMYTVEPGETIEFTLDWDDYPLLNTGSPEETISTSSWAITPDVSGEADLQSASNTSTTTTVFIVGAVLGHLYRLTNTVTTSEGRTHVRSVYVKAGAL